MKKLEFIGRVGAVEAKENSQSVSVAINESVKEGDGYADTTFWINCVVNKAIKVMKGDLVYVQGGFVQDVYKKSDETYAASLRCFANDFKIIMRKPTEEK